MNLAINPTALLPGAAPPGSKPENTALDFDKPAQIKTLESANRSRVKIQTKRRPPSRQARQASAVTPSLPTSTPASVEHNHDIPQVPTFNDRGPQPSSDLFGNDDQLAESSALPGPLSQSNAADEKQKLTGEPLSSIKSKSAVISDEDSFGGPITNSSKNKFAVTSNTDDNISSVADEKQKNKLTDEPSLSIKGKTVVASDEDLIEGPITNTSENKLAVTSNTDDEIFGKSSKSKLSSKPASGIVKGDEDIFSSKSVKSAENSKNKSITKVDNDDADIFSTKTETKKSTDFDKILHSLATSKVEEKSCDTEKETTKKATNDEDDIFADSSLFKKKELQEAKPQKVDTGTDTHDMGADASKELVETDEYAQYNQGSEQSPGNSVGRKTSSVSRNMSQISGDDMDGEGQLIDGYLRPVQVSTSGFIPPEVEIMEGQGILFRWMEIGSRLEVVQVIHDGDKLRPVIGGFESKDPDCKDREGNYVQKFTLEGEYKFALLSVRCTPLNVVVKRRLPLRAILTDRGFEPRIVTIDQGNSIEWTWRQCTVPHSVQEVQYIPDRGCFLKNIDQDNANNVVRTVTGNYLKKFPRPGLYFYQTESSELDRVHLSAVRVQSSTREYKIEISDRSFNPSVLLIETGDRVWWYWDKYKCKKLHCVYEIMAPSLDQDDDEPYKPVEKGFRWTAPSKQGLLSYVFNEPGVYYFSDQNFQEAAEYIGTIIVKPKPKEHFVRLTESGFEPDIAQIKTGERLWFRWDSQVCRNRNQLVLVKETEKCVNPSSSPNRPETPDDDEKFQYPDEEALKLCTDVGYASVFMRNTGVYHYRISRAPDSFSTCSVIVNPGEKNHTIHLTDSGPEQKVIMSVRPHDRVWWVWQSTKKQHNVIQVSHQGDPIAGGFCSGMLRDSPSAFVHTFTNPGVFYYKSQNLPKIFGAVVVTTQPIVHTVSIGTEIKPDPVEVKLYDIVCWLLNRPRTDDVAEIETTDQVMGGQMQSRQITPRRCLNRAISRTGVLHYFSKSFRKQKKSSDNFMDDVRFSSIICDERYDNTVVRVDNEGFHPHFVYVKKGESVRWTWIGTDQEHNIIHVTAPDSKEPLNVVSGAKSFNSGKQVKNNSFLYTFDVTGSYSVASQGAPGYCCTVFVIDSAQKVQTPTIPGTSMNGGTVDRYQTVQLECETPGVKIFYTIDGTPPELHIDSARLYKAEKGVKLKETGLCFIRAMAVKEGMLNSEIFTSKRFWVLSKETDRASETTSESGEERLKAKPTPAKNENWDWWSCAPTIKACFTDPGVMEVFWEEPNAIQKKLIKGYMIFLNGVSYCEMFPPTNNSLSICGLAGNRLYEVSIEVYAVQKKQNPQTSNKLMMKCPLMTKEGGPIVSLERSDKPDALVVVWMSIDTKEYPIKGYLVFLNEQQCGSMLVPDQDKNRCKVFIGGCELHKQHKIYVVALPRDNIDDARMSNIIEVTLPLDFSQLQLPDELDRIGDEELYQEYLAVQEGAGYLPEMDAKLNQLEISEVQRSTPGGRNVGSRRYKDRRGYTQQVVEVEDPRFRGVRPLKKQSNFHSKHFSQVEKSESSEKSKTSHGSMVTGKGNATPHDSAYPDAASPVPPAYEHGQPDHGSHLPQPPTQERPKTRNHFKGMSLADQIAQKRRVQDQAIPLEIDYTPAGQRANEREDYGSYSPAPHRLSSDYGQSHMSQTMNRGMTNQSRSYTSPSLMRRPSHQSHMSDKLPINRSLSQPSQMSANAQMNGSLTESQVYESPSLNRRFSQQIQGEDPYGYPTAEPQMSLPHIEDNIYGTDVSVTQKPATVDWDQQRRLDHISFKMAGKIATLKPPKIDIRIQRYKYPVSFKMVAKAVKNFITQEKIMMMGIAPGHMKKKYNFDWSRFRTWVKCTNAFEAQKNAQKVYELKAPSMKSLERTNEFVLNQDNPNENNLQQNFLEQQMDPDLYPEHHPGRFQRHWNDITNTVEKSLSFETVRPQRRQKYGQYLDVHPRKSYHTRSFDGVSPERIKRSPRYETRRDDYPRVGRSRSREERHSRSSRYDQHSRSRSRSHSYESLDSGRMHYSYGYHSYDGHSPRKKFSKDEFERHSGDHGFYESGSDYDEEYCDYDDYGEGSSDDYERDASPSYRGRSREPYHQQNRHQPHHQREKRDQYGSPIRSGRYDRFQDSSPEDKNRRYKNQRGFNTDFGVYGDKGSMRPPFLTMKEFNEMESHKKRKEKRKGRKHKERSPDRNYMMENEDPGLKTLGTYGKMFRGELLKDIVVEGDQSVMTDDNYEKSTQTPPGRRKIKTLQDSYDSEDLRQSRVAYRGKSPGGRRDVSESQSESETASDSDTESYSDSETESEASRISHDGSVVVVSMNKSKSGGAKMMRSSPRDTPREEVTALRSSGRGYVPLDRSEKLVKSDYSPRPPTDYSRSGRGTRAIIEVEDEAAEDFDASRALQSVTVTADRKHRRRIVQEGEYVYNEIRKEEDIGVPCPSVRLTSLGKTGVCVEWSVGVVNENYEVQQFIVNIVGRGFNTREINSHISFECNLVDQKGQSVRGTQHCWTLDGNRQKINIRGLYGGETYRIFVVANYGMKNSEGKAYEVQHTSSVIYYTTIGPPTPPMLRVVGVNFYRAKLEWDPPRMQRGLELLGYKVYVNNKPLIRGLLREDKRQMVIDDLIPGKTIGVYVKAILKQSEIESDPSREVHITCPRRPPPPHIEQQPLYKHGAVMIAWDKPSGVRRNANEESISKYEIYLNDKLYGEKTANAASDRQGYQFIINGLNPEQSYDVQVKSVAGQKNVDQDQSHIFCMSDSEVSNTVPVMAPASPKSPELRLENMSPNGIRVTWSAPQQYGGVEISGYRLLKNGKLYGDIMGPDVYAVDITGVRLGEKVVLQLVALTNHPVGKLENAAMHSTYERDSGSESSPRRERPDVFLGEKYAGCHPGPKLTLHYTGLVKSPSDVWFEQVTGHSALVVWTKEDNVQSHFVRPDHYVVTWWRGSHEKEDVRSEETKEDHLLITGLQPSTAYTVVVEARRMDYYKIGDDQESSSKNKFILTADSDSLLLKTARPPDPPSNLAVTASTCHGLRIVWDPPVEKGVEVIAIRIDAQSINTSDPHHMSFEVRPDENQADIEPLREKTDYVIRVTAVTDEYFDRLPEKHKLKKLRTLPRDRVVGSDDSVWLPNAYTMAKTAGTEPPANLKVIESSTTAMTISWVAPIAYGSNKLTGIVVRWSDVKNTKKSDSEWYVASHLNLDPSDNRVTVQDLTPGAQYKIVVEAVVSIKTSLENTSRDSDYEKYRRTANVMSKPLYARARAPTEPPRLYVTGYTQTTAQLYWEKPPLVSVIGKDSDGKPKYLRRYLEGYKLEINDRLHSCLGPNAQSCQLTKCKPGKKYNVVLVALTCTDQGKKERKRKYKGVYRNVNPQTVDYSALLQDEENLDPSPSDPQEIVLPTNQEGYVQAMDRVFKHDEDRDNSTFGDIELKWDIQGDRSDIISHVRQYNIIWSNNEDRQVQTKVVSADIRKTLIPVTRLKSVYDLLVEPDYFTDVLPQRNQRIQIVVPGPPDAPEIFLKSVSPEEFVIEWGEPRLYGGVRVRGYQVYLNDKKVGNELSNSHRKAVIPCRPNKNYKVQLVALSDNSFYSDSSKSNALHVNTSPNSPRQVAGEEWAAGDDQDMPVKVTQVTETSIHLDWNNFLETEGVDGYRIQWSSVAQPAQREVKLSSKDSSCIINNCLPGTTHFVRLVAMDVDGQILEKSRQMTIQTSAPPDSPVVTVRACNFRYIAVQWEKPNTYGDALVTGYKVYVNGIVESILNADQLSYTFTHGKWCQEYAFQIQALTSYDKLHSKVSEPLVVVWPGCRAPALRRLPTHSSSNIRIAWDDPYLTDGVKVKHFRAVCLESDTEKEVTPSIGPIHPHTREAEFKHLKRGSYSIHLEVHLYNTGDILCSEPIHVSPAPAPDPPRVTVTVVGLDERRALERLTCDLVNKRDRLIRKVGHKLKEIGALSHPLRAERNHAVIEGAQTLSRIEEILEDCFAALDHFTGQLIAHVSWSCPQSRSETQITGYKLLIDGKQYGSPMHDGIKTVRIKLGTEEPQHKLSMLSMTDKPQATSDESNTVDLLTETFRPFSFYCYHSIHNQAAKWPSHGCCKYQDSILYERQLAKKLANQGLLRRKVPPPSCSLLDIFEGEYKPLLGSHNKQFATCIFFWTPWCLSSQKVMASFSRFAREASSEFNFIAVTCGVNATQATDRKALIHSITSNGWREDGVIWHCTSQCASAIHEATNNVWKNSTAGSSRRKDDTNESFKDLTEILGIAGVPTFLFVHPDGYIAWHGRYSAYDYASFGAFMRHTFSEVIGTPCPVFKCDLCKNDMTIDEDALEPVLQLVRESPTANLNMRFPQENRPPSPKRPDSPVSTDQNYERLFLKRKQQSPKSKKKKLTVNHRPYSASTYVQLLKSPYMQKTVPSPKVLNKLLRPQSGGARLG